MEKKNFKSKASGIVISDENFKALPSMKEKDGYYLTAEEPTHKVVIEKGLQFINPIIAAEEVNKTDQPAGETAAKVKKGGKTEENKSEEKLD